MDRLLRSVPSTPRRGARSDTATGAPWPLGFTAARRWRPTRSWLPIRRPPIAADRARLAGPARRSSASWAPPAALRGRAVSLRRRRERGRAEGEPGLPRGSGAGGDRPPRPDASRDAGERRHGPGQMKYGLHKVSFRRMVLDAGGGRRALSRPPEANLSDAAHVVPDGQASLDGPAVPSGLPLCKTYHAAFGAHLIGADRDHHLHVSEQPLTRDDGPCSRRARNLAIERLIFPIANAVGRTGIGWGSGSSSTGRRYGQEHGRRRKHDRWSGRCTARGRTAPALKEAPRAKRSHGPVGTWIGIDPEQRGVLETGETGRPLCSMSNPPPDSTDRLSGLRQVNGQLPRHGRWTFERDAPDDRSEPSNRAAMVADDGFDGRMPFARGDSVRSMPAWSASGRPSAPGLVGARPQRRRGQPKRSAGGTLPGAATPAPCRGPPWQCGRHVRAAPVPRRPPPARAGRGRAGWRRGPPAAWRRRRRTPYGRRSRPERGRLPRCLGKACRSGPRGWFRAFSRTARVP